MGNDKHVALSSTIMLAHCWGLPPLTNVPNQTIEALSDICRAPGRRQ